MNGVPGATQTWLLKAALNPDEIAGYQEAVRWQNATDFESHISRSEVLLIPLIWRKYKAHLAGNALTDRFGGLYKKSFHNNSRQFHLLPQLLDVLVKGEFQYAFTNAVALNHYLYRDNGSRSVDEINILINPRDLRALAEGLKQIGFSPRYPDSPIEMCLSGQNSSFIMIHDSFKQVCLHCFPTSFHNQHLQNEAFLRDAEAVEVKGISIKVLSPKNLFVHLFLNNLLSKDWHWIADAALLQRKFGIPPEVLQPYISATNLFHTSHQILRFMCEEFKIGTAGSLEFYKKQPASLVDRLVMEADDSNEIKFRIARIANYSGLNNIRSINPLLVYKIIRWYIGAMRRSEMKDVPGKMIHFLRSLIS